MCHKWTHWQLVQLYMDFNDNLIFLYHKYCLIGVNSHTQDVDKPHQGI